MINLEEKLKERFPQYFETDITPENKFIINRVSFFIEYTEGLASTAFNNKDYGFEIMQCLKELNIIANHSSYNKMILIDKLDMRNNWLYKDDINKHFDSKL